MIFEITPKLATACLIFVVIQSFIVDFIMRLEKKFIKLCAFAIFIISYMIFINSGLLAGEQIINFHYDRLINNELTPDIIDFGKPHDPSKDYFTQKYFKSNEEDEEEADNDDLDERNYDIILSDADRKRIYQEYLLNQIWAQKNWDEFNQFRWWCPSENVFNVRFVLTNLFLTVLPGTPSSKLVLMVCNTLIEMGCDQYESWKNAEKNLIEALYASEMAEFYYYILTTH